jgi:ABC-2 type transport system ATP-binding protein
MNVSMELIHLTKNYGRVEAVKDLTLQIDAGEIFGFVGPNGSGKTTTMKMLCTITQPTSGTAVIRGYDIRKEPHKVRSVIGILFQEPSLDVRLTAWENMYFYSQLYWPGAGARQRRDRIVRCLDLVGLAGEGDAMVHTFSWGMKRRLEIGRALITEPPVLLLDEPTAGLDIQSSENIWKYLEDLNRERGITVFLATHDMEEAERCHRVGILDFGALVAADTPASLMKAHRQTSLKGVFLELTGADLRAERSSIRDLVKRRDQH